MGAMAVVVLVLMPTSGRSMVSLLVFNGGPIGPLSDSVFESGTIVAHDRTTTSTQRHCVPSQCGCHCTFSATECRPCVEYCQKRPLPETQGTNARFPTTDMDDRFDDLVDVNRRFWDASTPRKMETGSYLLDDFREGTSTLFAHEQEELGNVTGKSLLHLQCNNGLETLSLAREGADAVGIDISGESIRYGRELAAETGIDATFVQCDVYDVPAVLDESFDVVYTSRGVLVWLPDLGAWAEVIADALTDDGVFYLYEGHPVADVFDDEFEMDGSYFDATPRRHDSAGFGVDQEHYQIQHTLGDVLTALTSAGLRIEFVHEFPFAFWHRWDGMVADDQGRWTLPGDHVPLSFSVRAVNA